MSELHIIKWRYGLECLGFLFSHLTPAFSHPCKTVCRYDEYLHGKTSAWVASLRSNSQRETTDGWARVRKHHAGVHGGPCVPKQ